MYFLLQTPIRVPPLLHYLNFIPLESGRKKGQSIAELPFVRKQISKFDCYSGPEKGRLGIIVVGGDRQGFNLRIRRAYVPAASEHRPRPWQ